MKPHILNTKTIRVGLRFQQSAVILTGFPDKWVSHWRVFGRRNGEVKVELCRRKVLKSPKAFHFQMLTASRSTISSVRATNIYVRIAGWEGVTLPRRPYFNKFPPVRNDSLSYRRQLGAIAWLVAIRVMQLFMCALQYSCAVPFLNTIWWQQENYRQEIR